jgi:transposase
MRSASGRCGICLVLSYSTTVVVESYRVKCPRCGIRAEKVASCRVRRRTASDLRTRWDRLARARRRDRYRDGWAWLRARCERLIYGTWSGGRRVGGIGPYGRWTWMSCTGARRASLSPWCAIWRSRSRCGLAGSAQRDTEFFRSQLSSQQRKRIELACVDMWAPFRKSIEEWATQCKIVYDKFHPPPCQRRDRRSATGGVLPPGEKEARPDQREKVVVDEPMEEPDQRATRGIEPAVSVEPARLQGLPAQRELVEVWDYRYEGAMFNYLQKWMDQLKWQR